MIESLAALHLHCLWGQGNPLLSKKKVADMVSDAKTKASEAQTSIHDVGWGGTRMHSIVSCRSLLFASCINAGGQKMQSIRARCASEDCQSAMVRFAIP